MSALQRTEFERMVVKYCRAFEVARSAIKTGSVFNKLRGEWEWSVWCPTQPELPVWGMGADEDWEGKPHGRVFVSRRKRP